ncbi:MAG: aminopeptidase [Clostridia bacterium]|nr:aminopeptidase [Clostridia bacterium]
MRDERLNRLARLLINYSIALKEGELFEINAAAPAKPLIKELIREGQAAGAVPFVKLTDDELARLCFGYIDPAAPEKARAVIEQQIAWETVYWDKLAAHVDIGVDENDAELSAADERAMRIYRDAHRVIRDRMIDEKRWVYLHWPTMADAQKAGMCYDDFYEFFINAALVDYDRMAKDMEPLVELLDKTDMVRIVGPGTDLSFSIRGIPAVPCHGEMNIPDGEVYTAPVKDSANGHIRYNTAAMRYGKKFDNPRLVFKNGHIDEADCDGDAAGFNEMLDADEGARYLGEFALGVNNAITKAIGNTLYDEKIGGSFHLTPGCAYADAFNGNKSQLHLDIVCIQTPAYGGGEIWFDGRLIRKDGLFTLDSLQGLNP